MEQNTQKNDRSPINEPGVLVGSRRRFNTPSALARQVLLYPTRAGRYIVDERYDFSDASAVAKASNHQNYIFLLIEEGEIEVSDGSRVQRMGVGEIALLDCRSAHRWRMLRKGKTLFVHFDGANADDFFALIRAAHGGKLVMPIPQGSAMKQDLVRVFEGMDGVDRASETELSRYLYGALCDLLVPPRGEARETMHEPVGKAVNYIAEHLAEELSVAVLAEQAALSLAHFSRTFKQQTGSSPHEFIVIRRIDEAKRLLHTTGLPVREIAFRVGYRSEANFIASFTAKVGITPSAFRKSLR